MSFVGEHVRSLYRNIKTHKMLLWLCKTVFFCSKHGITKKRVRICINCWFEIIESQIVSLLKLSQRRLYFQQLPGNWNIFVRISQNSREIQRQMRHILFIEERHWMTFDKALQFSLNKKASPAIAKPPDH